MKKVLDALMVGAACLSVILMSAAAWNGAATAKGKFNARRELAKRSQLVDSLAANYSGRAVLGNPHGTLTVIEFFDYECPACRVADSVLRKNLKVTGPIRLIVLNRPLTGIHPTALLAARAGICAERTESFSSFHHAAYEGGPPFTLEKLAEAMPTGSFRDTSELRACAFGLTTSAAIETQQNLGDRLKVLGTPTFIGEDGRELGLSFVAGLVENHR